jgi:hypothetical protein
LPEIFFVPRVKQIEALLQKKSLDPKVAMDVGAGYGVFLEEYKNSFPLPMFVPLSRDRKWL